MRQVKDNKYGYRSWSVEDLLRFGRFLLLPLLVIALIAVILIMDKKNDPGAGETNMAESSSDAEDTESSAAETESPAPETQPQEFTINGVPEVVDLLNQYFTAKQNADAATIYRLFGWTEEIGIDGLQRQLQYDARYTEGYRNIVCYTKPGETEGTYLVCVSYDLKFKNSLTLAPGFQWSYVRPGADGTLHLTVDDELSPSEKAYVDEALQADEIVLLRIELYAKLRAALESDASLAEGYAILERKGGSAGAAQTESHEAMVEIEGMPTTAAQESTELPAEVASDPSEELPVPQAGGEGSAEGNAVSIHIEGESTEIPETEVQETEAVSVSGEELPE